MRRLWCALALGLLLGIAGSARADEQADLKAVIDKAIKAHGGEANLTKYKAATWKGKGTYHGQGQAIPFSAEWFSQPPGQHTVRVEAEANGMKFMFIEVVNGDKGWSKAGEELKEMGRCPLVGLLDDAVNGDVTKHQGQSGDRHRHRQDRARLFHR